MTPVKLLMVEDNRGDVVLTEEAIGAAGLDYRMTVVHDGVAALEYLCRQGVYAEAPLPDLVLLDLKLPRKSGREVLADIAANPVLRDIPVAVLSSSHSEIELARLERLPRQTFLVKPARFAEYVELLKTIEAFRQSTGGDARERAP